MNFTSNKGVHLSVRKTSTGVLINISELASFPNLLERWRDFLLSRCKNSYVHNIIYTFHVFEIFSKSEYLNKLNSFRKNSRLLLSCKISRYRGVCGSLNVILIVSFEFSRKSVFENLEA